MTAHRLSCEWHHCAERRSSGHLSLSPSFDFDRLKMLSLIRYSCSPRDQTDYEEITGPPIITESHGASVASESRSGYSSGLVGPW